MTTTGDPPHKIGDLADSSGVTVRTLRYYEEIELLTPSGRTDAGHRIYGQHEVERLYHICFLRQLGMPLDGVRRSLAGGPDATVEAMTAHLAEIDQRLATENRLRARLARLIGTAEAGSSPTEIINVLEDMNMLDTTINRPIATLVCADIARAVEHLTTVFGLGPGDTTAMPDGTIVHGEIEVGSGTVWLHPESEDFSLAAPSTHGHASATMVVLVDDVDAHHAHAVSCGAEVRYAPTDQPYGYREYGVLDSEGHLWSFMKPLA